jgi:TonB family protein
VLWKTNVSTYSILIIINIVILCMPLNGLNAQVPKQIERLAAQTAKKVAKTDTHRILTTPLAGCLGAPQLCDEFDAVLHTNLEKLIPDVKFIQREEAVKHLTDHGFLGVDAYMGALDDVASDAGAEVVIGEDFQRKGRGCDLRTTVTDAKHLYALGDLATGISCSAVLTKTTLSLLKDPISGVSMIVPLPQLLDVPAGASPIHFPSCVSCPDPHYTGDAKQKGIQGSVRILITVTEQGAVENARAVGGVEVGLELASLRAVSGWHLKPATDSDGKPFPARVPVEVTFRLLP